MPLTAPTIVAHINTADSWDMLCVDSNFYIVRNDLGGQNSICFKIPQTRPFVPLPFGSTFFGKVQVFSACEAMSRGTSYFGRRDGDKGYKYCIKEQQVVRVEDMGKGGAIDIKPLAKGNENGVHYWQRDGKFYILDANGKFGCDDNLQQEVKRTRTLRSDVRNLLAVCAEGDLTYFLVEDPQLGVIINTCQDIESTNKPCWQIQVPPEVRLTLPGGLSSVKGPGKPDWIPIWSQKNLTSSSIDTNLSLEAKKGYSEEQSHQVTENWEITESVKVELKAKIFKTEIGFSSTQGREEVNASSRNWTTEKEDVYDLNVSIPAGETRSIFQLACTFVESETEPAVSLWNFCISDGKRPTQESAQEEFDRLYTT